MMMSDACCTSARKCCSRLAELGLDPFGLDGGALEQLDRERDPERGEHREPVHERLLHQRRRDARPRSRARRRLSAATLITIDGTTAAGAREPDAFDRAEDQADREHRSPADGVHHGGDPEGLHRRRAPRAASRDVASPQSAVVTHDIRNVTDEQGAQRARAGVDAIRSRRRAAQNTGTTTGSVSTVGSTSCVQKRVPKARRRVR